MINQPILLPLLSWKKEQRTYAKYRLLFKMKIGGWISAAKMLHYDLFSKGICRVLNILTEDTHTLFIIR